MCLVTPFNIPLIVVTGSISEEVAVELIKQGATDYILKDRMARLGASVRRALEEKTLAEEKERADKLLRSRYRELEILHELVLISPDLQTVLEKILDKAASLGPFDLANIRLERFDIYRNNPSGNFVTTALIFIDNHFPRGVKSNPRCDCAMIHGYRTEPSLVGLPPGRG